MQSRRPKHRRKNGVKQPRVDFSSRRCVDIGLGIRAPASVMTLPNRVLSRLLLLLVAPTLIWAQAGHENSTACAKCHAEGRTQPATDMAHALETVEQARILIDHPLLTATYGKYAYRIERKGDQSLYSVTDRTATITMPIRWAMGASSALGQTFILEKDGKFYESRLSWFRELNGLGPTLGGHFAHPADLNEAAGRLMSQSETLRCFGCHATNAVSGKQLTLDKMTPGVQCSHCHEAAEAHLAAMAGEAASPRYPPDLAICAISPLKTYPTSAAAVTAPGQRSWSRKTPVSTTFASSLTAYGEANATIPTTRASVAWPATTHTRNSAHRQLTMTQSARPAMAAGRSKPKPVRSRKTTASRAICPRSNCRAPTTSSPIIASAL